MIEEQRPSDAHHQGFNPDDHLSRLLLTETDVPWYKSFVANVRDTFNPPKLPPLELTSKPVKVKSIWDRDENKGKAGVTSLLVHAGLIGLVLALGGKQIIDTIPDKPKETLYTPLAAYQPKVPQKAQAMGGGGGGGDRSITPASKGKLPRAALKQFTPPTAVIRNEQPKLVVEPTIIAQQDAPLPKVDMPNFGNPLGILGPPSNGPGANSGIGSGRNGGVGPGSGQGYGPGRDGNTGGGVFRIGGQVSTPVAIFRPEPEYSEEARKAKFQGAVLLSIVINADGSTSNIRVVRALGLGLDEKAIEAVTKWRFKPSTKDGKPVAVSANVEVNFRLL